MTVNPKTIGPDALAEEGAALLQRHKIQALLVVGEQGDLVGALNVQDFLKAGVA